MHSKRVPALVLPDRCLQARGLQARVGPYGGERFLAEGSSRHAEQDEARHDDSRNENGRTTAVLAP